MKQEIHEIEENEFFGKQFKFINVFEKYGKYLVQLLIDNRPNDFHRIYLTNNIFKSCQIKIFDEIDLKNFTPGVLGIENTYLEFIVYYFITINKFM
jgi:hypothetical protein